jgi:hypothetical protein
MSEILDLTIQVTPPPPGSGALATVDLSCHQLGLTAGSALLLDPLSSQEREELRWYTEEFWKWPHDEWLERAERARALLITIGRRPGPSR